MTDYLMQSMRARWVATISVSGLLSMMLLTTVWMPTGGRAPNWTVGLLLAAPLLILLPGVLLGGVRAHAWASFLSLLYFAIAVTNLFLPRRGATDWVELLLSVALFLSAMMYVRWRSRALRSDISADEV